MTKIRSRFSWRRQRPTDDDSPTEQHSRQNGDDSLPSSPSWQIAASSQTPPARPFPSGVEVLSDCLDAVVDICFVHGLTGDRLGTWTASGQATPWPQTLLPPRLGKARILTYGYDAYILRPVASTNRLIDHAANLLNDLTTDRASSHASTRPLVFVAHSLGGLVVKQAILLSQNNPELHLRGVFDCTKGIIFMGTPHRGSWMAVWAQIPALALRVAKSSKSLLDVLETGNPLLEDVQVRFWQMVREQREGGRRLEITCFFEELPLPAVGTVVSKASATLEGYTSFSIHANHRDMARFATADDSGFKKLLGELVRWETEINTAAGQSTRPMEEVQIGKPASWSFHNHGPGNQFNAPGGVQNISNGSGNRFAGATFSGPVQFG